jgi:hypothetical protein
MLGGIRESFARPGAHERRDWRAVAKRTGVVRTWQDGARERICLEFWIEGKRHRVFNDVNRWGRRAPLTRETADELSRGDPCRDPAAPLDRGGARALPGRHGA